MNFVTASAILIVAMLTPGCAQTTYVGISEEKSATNSITRTVGLHIDPAFVDEFPECTVILEPTTGSRLQRLNPLVEETLSRHLSRHFTRVIDAAERRQIAHRQSLDLRHLQDQKELAEIVGCSTLLRSRVVGPGKTDLFVWSQVKVGIEVVMVRARDNKVIWRARHIADRSEGGIPFSPIGFITEAYSSVSFSADGEIAESVIDDAVRRIVQSLSNMRTF